MPTPSTSIAPSGPLLWLAGLFVLGFAVTWLLTDLGGMRRTIYIFFLTTATLGFTAGYLIWSGTDTRDFLLHNWGLGLLGAAVAGALLGIGITQQGAGLPRHGSRLGAAVIWEGAVYGIAEGLLLSVLPVLFVWQSGWLADWSSNGLIVAGVLGVLASAAFIAVHHLGYRGLRGPQLITITPAVTLLSVAYALTASPLAPVIGHIVTHVAAVTHGTEMPPYAEGHEAAAEVHLGRGRAHSEPPTG